MRTLYRLAVVILILLTTTAMVSAQSNPLAELEGTYHCSGQNPGDGTKYEATVTIVADGDILHVGWQFAPNSLGVGMGMLNGSTVTVIFEINGGADGVGVASYTIERGEHLRLVGTWLAPQIKLIGTETLTKTAGPDQKFRL